MQIDPWGLAGIHSMKTSNPEVSRHLLSYSDHALRSIERDLRRNRPEWQAKEWSKERLELVRAEIARRAAEDAQGIL